MTLLKLALFSMPLLVIIVIILEENNVVGQEFEELCNGCPCMTNCRAGCGVLAYQFKKNKWCQRCGCPSPADLARDRERDNGLCDGCPCMGACPHHCGVFAYEYNRRTCQRCGCASSQDILSDREKHDRDRLEREREKLEREREKWERERERIERERERIEREREKFLCDGCPCMGICRPECGVLSYQHKPGKWCQKCGCSSTVKNTSASDSKTPDGDLCDGCPCIGVCRDECGVFGYEYKKGKFCQKCGCDSTLAKSPVKEKPSDKPETAIEQLCDGCPCMGVCRDECGVFSFEYKKGKFCQRCGCDSSMAINSGNLINESLCDGCPCMGVCSDDCGVFGYEYKKGKFCQRCGCDTLLAKTPSNVKIEPLCDGCPCMGVCRDECGVFAYEYKKGKTCQKCGCNDTTVVVSMEKQELCDGCPCIGLCKPECGVFAYEYKKKPCQQCGCRDTSASEAEKDGGEVLCNGCPCIGVCRPDCGVFSYEYKRNVTCQQCGCQYQDMSFKDASSALAAGDVSLVDQVLQILKSLGLVLYKPAKPIRPLKPLPKPAALLDKTYRQD